MSGFPLWMAVTDAQHVTRKSLQLLNDEQRLEREPKTGPGEHERGRGPARYLRCCRQLVPSPASRRTSVRDSGSGPPSSSRCALRDDRAHSETTAYVRNRRPWCTVRQPASKSAKVTYCDSVRGNRSRRPQDASHRPTPSMRRHARPCNRSASRNRACSASVQRSRCFVITYGFRA